MKNTIARTFALFLALALLQPAPARAADPFELYAISELTGSAGFVGKNEVIALQAFENRLNASGGIDGHPLKFIIQDAASDPKVAVQLTTALVAKKVNLIRASLAATCSAEQPLVKNGPLAFCLSNAVIRTPATSCLLRRSPREIMLRRVCVLRDSRACGA